MTGIKDFFEELKIRIANPLISSFIISWLVCNWKIVVLLLFYKSEDFPVDGSTSYIDYISDNYNFLVAIFMPMVGAVAYTAASPIVSAKVKLFYAEISAKNNSDILKSTDERSMPMKKYIKLLKEINDQKKEIQELAAVEGQITLELEEKKRELEGLKSEFLISKGEIDQLTRTHESMKEYSMRLIKEIEDQKEVLDREAGKQASLDREVKSWRKFNDISTLNGTWELRVGKNKFENHKGPSIKMLVIKDGEVTIDRRDKAVIREFAGNFATGKISFIMYTDQSDDDYVGDQYFLTMTGVVPEKFAGSMNGKDPVTLISKD